jgi:hypothetical protein
MQRTYDRAISERPRDFLVTEMSDDDRKNCISSAHGRKRSLRKYPQTLTAKRNTCGL